MLLGENELTHLILSERHGVTQLGGRAYLASHCRSAAILPSCGLCVVSMSPSASQTLIEPARRAGENCQGASHSSLGKASKARVRSENILNQIRARPQSRAGGHLGR